jgi:hypothetical protein
MSFSPSILFLAVVACPAHLLAQVLAAGPATQPASRLTSQPASRPALSLDTPRNAVKWFAAALRDGDTQRLAKVVAASNDAERHMVAAMGEMAKALAKLHTAALAAFGPEAASRFTSDTSSDFERTLARIDAAEVLVDGDSATVRYAEPDAREQDKPFKLQKVGAAWLIPASQFSGGAAPEVLDRQVAELIVQARIVTEISQEIAANKYKNADAAGLAWRSRMMAAVGGTGPTTKPK